MTTDPLTLGPYRIKRLLARGSAASVYLACHPPSQRDLALKVYRDSGRERMWMAPLLKWYERLANLSHPHIAAIQDVGQVDNRLYVAMQFVAGRSMADVVAQERWLSPRVVMELGHQIASALEWAHRRGLLHLDLKPDNILLSQQPGEHYYHATVLDFVHGHLAEATRYLEPAERLGSPEYWSPEYASGRPLDGRSDVYSLGIVLYEALCGSLPFRSHSYTDLIAQHLNQRLTGVPTSPGDFPIPPELELVILKCLEKEPADRFADAAQLRRALERLLVMGGRIPQTAEREVTVKLLSHPGGVVVSAADGAQYYGRTPLDLHLPTSSTRFVVQLTLSAHHRFHLGILPDASHTLHVDLESQTVTTSHEDLS